MEARIFLECDCCHSEVDEVHLTFDYGQLCNLCYRNTCENCSRGLKIFDFPCVTIKEKSDDV